MFQLTYMFRELRRRLGRTILTALGLAAGVGLVIAIIGVSKGLDQAQAKVLAPLQSVGTDILVTRVVGASPSASPSPSASTQTQNGGGGFFAPDGGGGFGGGGFGGGFGGGGFGGGGFNRGALNASDVTALANENNNVVTDLSKLGKAGTKFTHDFFLSATLLSFPQAAVQQITALPGVSSAVGGLTQLAEHQTGTVPQIVAELQTGGQTVNQTFNVAPPTAAEQAAIQACFQKRRAAGGGDFGPPGGGGGGGSCLPARFRQFRAQFRTPLQTIRQVVNPPQTNITNQSYTAAGIDPATPTSGLVTQTQLTSGAWITAAKPDDILVNVAYANKQSLKVGSSVAINGATYTVAGLVNPTLTGNTADIYFNLATLQKLAGKTGRVTQVLVKATSAQKVDEVAAAIRKALPGAEVVTTKTLADQVTGSLADAKNLATRLGGAVGGIVLASAFAIALLLTLSSIAKRVREIGTLRAIGWSKARIVRQVLSETLGIGLLGGILGIGVGVLAAALVGVVSPPLTATGGGVPSFASSSLANFVLGQGTQTVASTKLSLHAPVSPMTMLLGVGFALVGGLLAGAVGGWRAARMSPAEALRNVG